MNNTDNIIYSNSYLYALLVSVQTSEIKISPKNFNNKISHLHQLQGHDCPGSNNERRWKSTTQTQALFQRVSAFIWITMLCLCHGDVFLF